MCGLQLITFSSIGTLAGQIYHNNGRYVSDNHGETKGVYENSLLSFRVCKSNSILKF